MPPSTSRVIPRSKDNFTWTGGWVTTTPQQAADIATRYGPKNPNLTDPEAAPTPQPPQATAAPAVPPAAPPQANPVTAPTPAAAPTPAPEGVSPGGALVNPNVGNPAAQAEQNWMDRGGSLATMHRAQVAEGRRPVIDARATPAWQDAGESASDQIRAGFGSGPGQEGHNPWPAVQDFGNAGSAIWADMTQKFNQSKAKLRQSIAPASPTPTQKPVAGSSGEDAAAFTN